MFATSLLLAASWAVTTSGLPCVSDSDCYPPLWPRMGFVCVDGDCVKNVNTKSPSPPLTFCERDSDCTQLANGECFHRTDGGHAYCLYPRHLVEAAANQCTTDSDCSEFEMGECLQNYCIYPHREDDDMVGEMQCHSNSDCTEMSNGLCLIRPGSRHASCVYPDFNAYECFRNSDCSDFDGGECWQNYCIYPHKDDDITPVGTKN